MRRTLINLSGLLIAANGFIGQTWAGPAPDKIRFPYSPIFWNSLPWWMAKDAGRFERNGLDVELLYEGASSVIVQAMLAGEQEAAGDGVFRQSFRC